jgi:hypothetical protein
VKGLDITDGASVYSRKKVDLTKVLNTTLAERDIGEPVKRKTMPEALTYTGALKLSTLSHNRIRALWNIDQIKDRNKPVETVNTDDKVPFFLPDSFNIVKAPVTEEAEEGVQVVTSTRTEFGALLSESSDAVVMGILYEASPSKIELLLLELSATDEIAALIEFLLRNMT